jgi:hypothetical protein
MNFNGGVGSWEASRLTAWIAGTMGLNYPQAPVYMRFFPAHFHSLAG